MARATCRVHRLHRGPVLSIEQLRRGIQQGPGAETVQDGTARTGSRVGAGEGRERTGGGTPRRQAGEWVGRGSGWGRMGMVRAGWRAEREGGSRGGKKRGDGGRGTDVC
eukprot:6039049-Prymnesium_polylepis.2